MEVIPINFRFCWHTIIEKETYTLPMLENKHLFNARSTGEFSRINQHKEEKVRSETNQTTDTSVKSLLQWKVQFSRPRS